MDILLGMIFDSGRYFSIMGTLLTIGAIIKNYEVYKVPKHLKNKFYNRKLKLVFSICIAWLIPGITATISEVFANPKSKILFGEPMVIRSIFLFIYSTIIPIIVFFMFLKKYYSSNN